MLKPKMVFTVLAVWWAFHIIILWILNPMAVEALISDDKAQLMNRSLGYIAGTMSMLIAFIFYMLREIDHSKAKQVLLGTGIIMVAAVAIIIASNIFKSAGFLDGKIQELILYPSDQSANRLAIETNINNHYTIY